MIPRRTTKVISVNSHNTTHMNRIGLWLFILSETFLFGALIATRFYLDGVQRPEHGLNQALGLGISIILLMSSLAAYRGEIAASVGDQKKFKLNILFTVVLAFIFLVGVGVEWWEALHYFPPSTLYGTIFFTMTGLHAFHVLTGMIALIIVLNISKNRRFNETSYWGVEGTVKYWHFVDVAWVFIYPTLYLVN